MVLKVELFFLFQSASQKTYNRLIESLFRSFYLILFCSYVFLFALSFVCVLTSAQRVELMNKVNLKSAVKTAEQ